MIFKYYHNIVLRDFRIEASTSFHSRSELGSFKLLLFTLIIGTLNTLEEKVV